MIETAEAFEALRDMEEKKENEPLGEGDFSATEALEPRLEERPPPAPPLAFST